MNREEFERLEEIKCRLSQDGVYWDESINDYDAGLDINSNILYFVEGAWYAWQEQQERIDILTKQAKCNHTFVGKSENQYCAKCGIE